MPPFFLLMLMTQRHQREHCSPSDRETPKLHHYSPVMQAARHYDIKNRKLLTVKPCLEEWFHWLEAAKHPFVIFTDHHNLVLARIQEYSSKCAFTYIHSVLFQEEAPESILPESCFVGAITCNIDRKTVHRWESHPTPLQCSATKTYVPLHFWDALSS